jgi:hypothetical protein
VLPWRTHGLLLGTGGVGGGVHFLAGVRDVRGGGDQRQRREAHIAARAVGRRRADRDGDDLLRRPHLRRAHEPRRHARVRRVQAFPMDSGKQLTALSSSAQFESFKICSILREDNGEQTNNTSVRLI